MRAVTSYPKRELWRLRRKWLARYKRAVLGCLVLFASALVVMTWWAAQLDLAAGWYVVGLLHAGTAATLLHILNTAVLAHEPRAIHQLRGTWGEDNTRSELDAARRKKLVWGWVDSIALASGDLDHVVITRNAGVVMLDSKFHTGVTRQSVADMTASAVRARSRAEALARTLLRPESRGRRQSTRTTVKVTSCIVLWGPARASVPDDHQVDGVHFVDGRRLSEWLRRLPPSPVSEEAARDFLTKLESYRASVEHARR